MTNLRIRQPGIEAVARIGKALDHPLRIRALAALRGRELCVCELVDLFDLAASTISKHMSIVADAGLVERRRDGKWTYYSRPSEPDAATNHAFELIDAWIEDDPVVAEDLCRIDQVCCRSEANDG